MKSSILILLLISLFAYTCVNAQANKLRQFNRSFNTWKKLNPCTYSYTRSKKTFTLYTEITRIDVDDGKVVKRELEAWYQVRETPQKAPLHSWVEATPKEIGTHEVGAPPLMMESLFKVCRERFLVQNPRTNNLYFTVDSQGLMKQCGYAPKNCNTPECYKGFTLEELTIIA